MSEVATSTDEIKFLAPEGSLSLSHADVCSRLAAEWERTGYERFAGGPLDATAGTSNPYWEIVRLMQREIAPWGDPWPLSWDHENRPLRNSLTKLYAWSIPSPADLLWMRDILNDRGVVEIGAGSGYWAWQLSQLGVDVVAFDNWDWKWERSWFPVAEGNTTAARHYSDRALMLVWPPYSSPMAKTALDFYDGDLLFYAGEGNGGCTGDDAFHDELERSWSVVSEAPSHPTFEGIHCRLTAYRREVSA